MKKLVLGLVAMLMFGFVGNAQFNVKQAAPLLAKDKNFVAFINNVSKIPNETKIEDFKSIIEKKEIKSEDLKNLAIAFGFKDLDQAQKFDSENSPLLKALVENHSLDKLKHNDLKDLVQSAIILIPQEQQPVAMGDCKERRLNCRIGSAAIYTLEAAGCISVGAGLAGVTFWCGGCLGAAVGSACIAAASTHYYTMLQDCNFAYTDCINK